MTTPEALAAKLEALKDGLVRIEAAIRDINVNINDTRHAGHGQMQRIYSSLDLIDKGIIDLRRDMVPLMETAKAVAEGRSEVRGGRAVFGWLWPVILMLAGAALAGGGVWIGAHRP